jgi:hypothetical protein
MLELSEKDKILIENLLVEILTMAIKSASHIRPLITDIAIGLSNLLPEESVGRAKEYAAYRARDAQS